jgi:hypothetical protein
LLLQAWLLAAAASKKIGKCIESRCSDNRATAFFMKPEKNQIRIEITRWNNKISSRQSIAHLINSHKQAYLRPRLIFPNGRLVDQLINDHFDSLSNNFSGVREPAAA